MNTSSPLRILALFGFVLMAGGSMTFANDHPSADTQIPIHSLVEKGRDLLLQLEKASPEKFSPDSLTELTRIVLALGEWGGTDLEAISFLKEVQASNPALHTSPPDSLVSPDTYRQRLADFAKGTNTTNQGDDTPKSAHNLAYLAAGALDKVNARLTSENAYGFHADVALNMIETVMSGIDAKIQLKEDIKDLDKNNYLTIVAARSIVALGEYSGNSPKVMALLDKIAGNPEYKKVHAPDWVMFADQYEWTLRRIGIKGRIMRVLDGESEHEMYLGTQVGKDFARLATEAKERILRRTTEGIEYRAGGAARGFSLSLSYRKSEKMLLVKFTNITDDVVQIGCYQEAPIGLSFEIQYAGRGYEMRPKSLIELDRLGGFIRPTIIEIKAKESQIIAIPLKDLASSFDYEEALQMLQFKANSSFQIRALVEPICSPLIEVSK